MENYPQNPPLYSDGIGSEWTGEPVGVLVQVLHRNLCTPHSKRSVAQARERAGITGLKYFRTGSQALMLAAALKYTHLNTLELEDLLKDPTEVSLLEFAMQEARLGIPDRVAKADLPALLQQQGCRAVSESTLKRAAKEAGVSLAGKGKLDYSEVVRILAQLLVRQGMRGLPSTLEPEQLPRCAAFNDLWEMLQRKCPTLFNVPERTLQRYRQVAGLERVRLISGEDLLHLAIALLLKVRSRDAIRKVLDSHPDHWRCLLGIALSEGEGILLDKHIQPAWLPKPMTLRLLPLHYWAHTGELCSPRFLAQLLRSLGLRVPSDVDEPLPEYYLTRLTAISAPSEGPTTPSPDPSNQTCGTGSKVGRVEPIGFLPAPPPPSKYIQRMVAYYQARIEKCELDLARYGHDTGRVEGFKRLLAVYRERLATAQAFQ